MSTIEPFPTGTEGAMPDNLPSPPRRWAIGPHTDCSERPLEPGDEFTIANASPHRLRVVAARECDPADPRHAAWTERCARLERERDALIAEVHRARHDAHAAVAELSAVSRRLGLVVGVLGVVADRLDYLQGLWGREAITDRMAAAIRETLAEVEAEMPGDDDRPPRPIDE